MRVRTGTLAPLVAVSIAVACPVVAATLPVERAACADSPFATEADGRERAQLIADGILSRICSRPMLTQQVLRCDDELLRLTATVEVEHFEDGSVRVFDDNGGTLIILTDTGAQARALSQALAASFDPDSDGVGGCFDRCPGVPGEANSPEPGCPGAPTAESASRQSDAPVPPHKDPDSDRDGIADADDECDSVPEDRDGDRDGDGCPEAHTAPPPDPKGAGLGQMTCSDLTVIGAIGAGVCLLCALLSSSSG